MNSTRRSRAAAPAHRPVAREASAAAKRLERLGIRREFDLVLHLPLRYEDETRITPIAAAPAGVPVQIEGTVVSTEIAYRPRRQLVCRVADESAEAVLRFFHFYPSQAKALSSGARVRAFGELRTGFFGGEMIHPRFRVLRGSVPLPSALTPIYPTTAGLSQADLRRAVEAELARASLEDTLPQEVLDRAGLCAFREAIDALHHPPPGADTEAVGIRTQPAWRRIKFDELLAQQLSMRRHYRERKTKVAPPLPPQARYTGALLARLPFRLTRAQERAWGEIERDLAQPHPMHRLL